MIGHPITWKGALKKPQFKKSTASQKSLGTVVSAMLLGQNQFLYCGRVWFIKTILNSKINTANVSCGPIFLKYIQKSCIIYLNWSLLKIDKNNIE